MCKNRTMAKRRCQNRVWDTAHTFFSLDKTMVIRNVGEGEYMKCLVVPFAETQKKLEMTIPVCFDVSLRCQSFGIGMT